MNTQVGFMSTEDESNLDEAPPYEDLESGSLGHIQIVSIQYDSNKVSYSDLVKFFFSIHDPTLFGMQGDDIGQQFMSVIFTHSESQAAIAQEHLDKINQLIEEKSLTCFQDESATTEIHSAKQLYFAKLDEQKHFQKNKDFKGYHTEMFKWSDVEKVEKETETKAAPSGEDARQEPPLKPDHNLVNICRRIILRLRPYMTSSSSP
jgi:methionine-S-sulfoxide reductase